MAFIHGKYAGCFFDGTDLSPYFNQISTSHAIEVAETTTFPTTATGPVAKTYITGLKDGTLSASGLFDAAVGAVDPVLAAALGGDSASVVTATPESVVLGKAAYLAAARQTKYEIDSPVGGVVSASVEVQADGGVERGVILAARSAVSATGNGTGVDNAALTSNGGVGHLHVHANTRDGTVTFKIQHSVDNSTWVDLVTFTGVLTTVVSGERIAVAAGTTVNRYLRSQYTVAGTTGSVTHTAAFARR